MFALLENYGYLPRVAFNMDSLFKRSGAHGKQSLTMAMGFGCNALTIMSTRIIESPRERMLAILTNNFVPCNGRWPMLILMASLFMVRWLYRQYANIGYCWRCSRNGCNWCYYDINCFLGTIKTALKGVPTHYTQSYLRTASQKFGIQLFAQHSISQSMF